MKNGAISIMAPCSKFVGIIERGLLFLLGLDCFLAVEDDDAFHHPVTSPDDQIFVLVLDGGFSLHVHGFFLNPFS